MARAKISKRRLEQISRDATERIKKYLLNGRVLQASDQELVNLFGETYAFYFRLKEELKTSPLLMEYTNKAGATNYIKNPLLIELTKTVQVLNNLLRSLGLTPAQRREFADEGFIPPEGGEADAEDERDEFEKF